MYKPIITAKDQLIRLILKLEEQKKSINTNEFIAIIDKIKCIYKNEELIDSLIISIKLLLNRPLPNHKRLTNREKQVLLLIGQDLKNNEIATKLNISASTIETHRKNIRRKLKIKGKDNLIVFALVYNLQYHNHN